MTVLRKSFYIHWSVGRSSRVHEVNPGRDPSGPLSTYICIICVEALSAFLNDAEKYGNIHRCKISRNAPEITHLFFADDCCLFFRANKEECSQIKEGRRPYEVASGQRINYQNSSVMFSPNTAEADREEFLSCLDIPQANQVETYLGLPSTIEQNKNSNFSYVKERIHKRINRWNKRLLSRAGNEVLLKTVVQAIPLYVMSVFLLPSSLCNDIERVMNAY